MRRILTRMLDEERFLSPFGIRSLSKWHEKHPYSFEVHGQRYEVKYLPGESDSGLFGGNSGDSFRIECPTGSGRMMNLFDVAVEIGRRLIRIFIRDEHGRRPLYGGSEKFQTDPHWRHHILFYEYFHGDNGAGLGASHQTGRTGLVAKLIQLVNTLDAETVLKGGTRPTMNVYRPPASGERTT